MTSSTIPNERNLVTVNDVTTSDVTSDAPTDSAVLDPGSSEALRPANRGLLQASSSPAAFTCSTSPEKSRGGSSWRRRNNSRFRRELGAIGQELRRAGVSLRGSMESLLNTCSIRSTSEVDFDEEKRRIRIEMVGDRASGNGRRRGGGGGAGGTPGEADGDGSDWTDDVCNDRNFSYSLILTNLENGLFSAQIALETIPFGNIIIRIRNYRLDIVLERRDLPPERRVEDSHRITHPQLIGTVDVPIYVDTTTLHFRLDAERDVLHLEGVMKGYLRREHSASAGDLGSMRRLRSKIHAIGGGGGGTNSAVVNRSLDDSVRVKDSSAGKQQEVGSNGDSWMDRFRNRAYTH